MTDQSRTTTLRAEGFSCPSCVTKIEKRVGRMDGVDNVTVQFASGRVLVTHQPEVTIDALVAAVAKAGYAARPSTF